MPYNDPFAMDMNAGGGDPIGMGLTQGLPDAQAPIGGGGVTPPPNPQQVAKNMGVQITGIPDMPVLPPPTMSHKLIAAGLGMIAADRNGIGLGGAMGAGMNAFNDQTLNYNDMLMKRRAQQLADYQLMGQIADRHNTELAMQRKLQAGEQFKKAYPSMASMYDVDPAAAVKTVTDYMTANGMSPMEGAPLSGGSGVPATPTVNADGTVIPAAAPTMTNPETLTGEDRTNWLKQYSPRRYEDAQMALSGTYPEMTPTNRSQYATVMRDATAIDKTFQPANYSVRKKTMEGYGPSGDQGKTITSIGAAAGHLQSAMDNFAKIHNGKSTPLNYVQNFYATAHDSKRGAALNAFKTDITNFAPEMAKIASGNGVASDAGTKEAASPFSENNPNGNIQGSFEASAGVIAKKYGSMMQQYSGTVGKSGPLYKADQFSPETKATFKGLGYDLDKIKQDAFNGQNAGAPPAAALVPAPEPAGAATPSLVPKGLPAPKTKAEYDALPAGPYIALDGTTKRKK